MIIHYPAAGADGGALAGLRSSLPARHLAKDITLFQSTAAKRITLHLHNEVP